MEQRRDRDEEFVAEFVKNGGNATQAALSVGVSEASARTIGYRLKMRLTADIDAEQREALKGYSSKALNQIQELAESAVSEKVKLDANKDLLDRAGWKPVDKSEVTEVNQWETASREELEAELLGYQQEWMENHLRSNNLKLVDASTGAEAE
jgi:phage terminase small subunit|tara:strand:+ start:330 stop:785 length:456 start_codon:yes stop_codon:yes gene_type:complete